jgi:hypothetical protein
MIDSELISALSQYLRENHRYSSESNSVLADAGYLESFEGKPRCERCGSEISGSVFSDVEGMVTLVCKGGHDFDVPEASNVRYRLVDERVLDDVCCWLGLDCVNVSTAPKYAIGETDQEVRVALVCRGANYEGVLDELFVDALKNHRVNAILIPDAFEGTAYDVAMKYPLGQLAPTFPLSMLSNPDAVRETVESARISLERSEYALEQGGWDTEDLHRNLEQNPRLIESELSYCRVFRETQYSGRLGDRLEEVCKAAFASMDFGLDPEAGGADDLFENVTDLAFLIPPSTQLKEDGGRIFGIADTKSASETHLGTEAIAKKHANYLRQASHPYFDNTHVAHIFVVFSMKGLQSNEIAWYDAIEKKYRGENDATMVVLYADALAQMVNFHLSMAQRNELNTSIGGGVTDAFRPFFNFRLFKRLLSSEIREMTRVDGESVTEDEEEYRREYFGRERLLVVTKEMVDARFREVLENDEIADILDTYPSERW